MNPPKTKKLFISYRSSDAAKVDKIAKDLSLLKHKDSTPRYTTWQDKHDLPPASPNWWDAVVDAIERCDMFVFNLSRASLQSEICRAELEYAHRRNRPIIPVVLDGEFILVEQSGKYDLPQEIWTLVPDWLGQTQFIFCVGTDFYAKFQEAVAGFERNWPRDIPAPRPLNPNNESVQSTNHALYDAACDYAERLAFADAEKHFDALVRRNDVDYADAAAQWLEIIRLYSELIEVHAHRHSSQIIFDKRWDAYQALFPKEFYKGVFDPKGFTAGTMPPNTMQAPDQMSLSPAPSPFLPASQARLSGVPSDNTPETGVRTKPRSLTLIPAPFAWIEIPKKGYHISKYPVTNAQYAKFVNAGGYDEEKWWANSGWLTREERGWTRARFSKKSEAEWNEIPVRVSWYEALAYCQWLSAMTSRRITLPTRGQWLYAAQGSDMRAYPWGNTWDCVKCNNSVFPCSSTGATPVRKFEGIGDSPFGVIDMTGNLWEWCTNKTFESLDFYDSGKRITLCGGWWDYGNPSFFRLDHKPNALAIKYLHLIDWAFRMVSFG